MEELYLWGTAILVGLASLKLIPADKLRRANRRMRSRIPGVAIIVLYFIICALFIVGAFFLCLALNAPTVVRNIIVGVLIGLSIGFTPIIDKRYSEDEEEKK